MCASRWKPNRSQKKMRKVRIISHENYSANVNHDEYFLKNHHDNDDDVNNHLVPNSASMFGRFDDRLCVPYRIRGSASLSSPSPILELLSR